MKYVKQQTDGSDCLVSEPGLVFACIVVPNVHPEDNVVHAPGESLHLAHSPLAREFVANLLKVYISHRLVGAQL